MTSTQNTFYANLFYSYSHQDFRYRDSMETALSMLRRDGLLKDWSDQNITPGLTISDEITKKMRRADIIVFLLSKDFINSDECIKEWENAKELVTSEKLLFRVPVILKDCAWKDLLVNDDIKALPDDAKPISDFDSEDTAWRQVYDGIKVVINELRNTFTPKIEFVEQMEKTDFLSQQHIKLQDIFVFLQLSRYMLQTKDSDPQEEIIKDQSQLLRKKYTLIHGEEGSGKTALGRYLFLSLANDLLTPVLHIDLGKISGRPTEKIFSENYRDQFSGDYFLWKRQGNKTLIMDNLSSSRNSIDFVEFAKDFFDRIIVTVSSTVFHAFLRDDTRLADFNQMKIDPLTHRQQEDLIRKRLKLSDGNEDITDGQVDQIENRINSIIISNKILPRYPFFVLSILQTYEGFMPSNLSITSYGHCYTERK